MLKVNVDDVPWETYASPKGSCRGSYKDVSLALGAARHANQFNGGHPFDLAIEKLGPGETLCPYHDHAAQYELFYIIAGSGTVRSSGENHPVKTGDVIMHPPGDAHQIINTGETDLTYILIADNPPLDVCRYPDSNKAGVFAGTSRRELFRMTDVDYWDGEE
jgi:uncharacterized cupin superfamily protein